MRPARRSLSAAVILLLSLAATPRPVAGETPTRAQLERQRDATQKSVDTLGRQAEQEVETILQGVDRDLDARQRALQQKVKSWTEDPRDPTLADLQRGVREGLDVARANGLDVARLTRIYELTKKVIRTADFEVGRRSPPPLGSELARRVTDTFLWAIGEEELFREAERRHQEYRVGLYRRAVGAYVRALAAGKAAPAACQPRTGQTVLIGGLSVPSLGCPDPVVDGLRHYLQAVRTIQSADTDQLIAEAERLVAEQQLVADLLSALPLLGDGMDLWAALSGEDLGGRCLSPLERVVTGTLTLLPMVGPQLLEQAVKRSPRVAEAVATVNAFLDGVSWWAGEVASGVREIGIDASERLARNWGTTVPGLTRLRDLLRRTPVALDDAAKARMRTFRTMREAAEDRLWSQRLPREVRERSVARAKEVLKANLEALQGSRLDRVRASNMVAEHVDALEQLSRQRGEIYGYRSVNPGAKHRIAAGAGTKPMPIKAKSAVGGPIDALLPVNQHLNKQGAELEQLLQKPPAQRSPADLQKIEELRHGMEKGADTVRECLAKPDECATAVVYRVPAPGGRGDLPLKVVKDRTTGRHVYAVEGPAGALLDPETGKALNVVADGPIEDVRVLADPRTGQYLTADYDFLDFGIKGQHDAPNFTRDKGFITARQREILDRTNAAIRDVQRRLGIDPVDVSHHGAERFFPFSPGALEVDEVVTFFDPERGLLSIPRCGSDCMKNWCRTTGHCNPALICGPGLTAGCIPPDPNRLLRDYYHDRRLAGYDIGPNSVWGWGHYNGLSGWTFGSYLGSLGGRGTTPLVPKAASMAVESRTLVQATVHRVPPQVARQAIPDASCSP